MPLWQYECSDSSSLSSTPPIPASPSHTTVLWQSVSTRAQAASNSKLTQRLYCSKCKTSGKGAVYCSRDCQVQKKRENLFSKRKKKREKEMSIAAETVRYTVYIYMHVCLCVCMYVCIYAYDVYDNVCVYCSRDCQVCLYIHACVFVGLMICMCVYMHMMYMIMYLSMAGAVYCSRDCEVCLLSYNLSVYI